MATVVRKTNIEAVRIVAMTMILIHHFLIHAITPDGLPYPLFEALNPLFMAGVNLFVMISGYFGIRLSLKSVLNLAVTVIAFNLINFLVVGLAFGEWKPISGVLGMILLPLSRSGYWFVANYFMLMILSPVINAGLKLLARADALRQGVWLMIAVMFVACWLGENHAAHNGYGILQFVFMYSFGYYLSHRDHTCPPLRQGLLVALFVAGVIGMFAVEMACDAVFGPRVALWRFFVDYCNPCLFVSTVSIFLLFEQMSFRSHAVDSLAASSFGCYLLQDGWLGHKCVYGWQHNFWTGHGIMVGIVMLVIFFVGYWGVSWTLMQALSRVRPAVVSVGSSVVHGIYRRGAKFLKKNESPIGS